MNKPTLKELLLYFLEGNEENITEYIYESYINDDNFNPLYTYEEAIEITNNIIKKVREEMKND
jgi:hypothetical protein